MPIKNDYQNMENYLWIVRSIGSQFLNVQGYYSCVGCSKGSRIKWIKTDLETFALGKHKIHGTKEKRDTLIMWVSTDKRDFFVISQSLRF